MVSTSPNTLVIRTKKKNFVLYMLSVLLVPNNRTRPTLKTDTLKYLISKENCGFVISELYLFLSRMHRNCVNPLYSLYKFLCKANITLLPVILHKGGRQFL